MNPRIHSELIKLWADGAEIEEAWWPDEGCNGEWIDSPNPSWHLDVLFRVKKEKKKYRVAKVRNADSFYTYTADFPDGPTEQAIQSWESFVEWLTGWIEYE